MSYAGSGGCMDFGSFGSYVGSGTGINRIKWVMGVVRILKFWELCGFWDKNQESYVGYGGYADFDSFHS